MVHYQPSYPCINQLQWATAAPVWRAAAQALRPSCGPFPCVIEWQCFHFAKIADSLWWLQILRCGVFPSVLSKSISLQVYSGFIKCPELYCFTLWGGREGWGAYLVKMDQQWQLPYLYMYISNSKSYLYMSCIMTNIPFYHSFYQMAVLSLEKCVWCF